MQKGIALKSFCVVLLLFIISCSGRSSGTTDAECQNAYIEAWYDLQSGLLDPDRYSENYVRYFKSTYEEQLVCAIEIDFTAANGFGGPGRKVMRYIYDMDDNLIVKYEK